MLLDFIYWSICFEWCRKRLQIFVYHFPARPSPTIIHKCCAPIFS